MSVTGDGWLLSSIGAVVERGNESVSSINKHIEKYDLGKNSSGVFRVQLWNFGAWMNVVIDDRLPTINGKLIFAKAAQEHVFWVALMEKAFAK